MILAILACTSGPEDTATELVDQPIPQVWGPEAAEDMDPAAGVVEIHLSASAQDVEWLDGTTTEMWAYNGQVPGPLIQANVGDTLRVVFTNDLEKETTIHWHGLRIDNLMDGVPAIQDPVQPGETFTYEFVLPESGTYWYHPHVRSYEQVERGLQGALIVHEPDFVDVSERMFVLDDAWVEDDGEWGTFMLKTSHPLQVHGRLGNRLVVNGQLDTIEDDVAGVERWRVVNTANAREMYISVDNADWRVIAVDGTLLPEPYTTNRENLPIGRRLDLEVIPTGDGDATLNIDLQGSGPADWDSYPMFLGTPIEDPGSQQDWNAAPLPPRLDDQQQLEIVFDVEGGGSDIWWTINGTTYGDHETIPVQANTPTLIRVKDKTQASHPFHLHGQFFQVVTRNDEDADEPGLMDTVQVGGRDELYLYTEFENPGLWMAHCHILEHAERGMMTEIDVQ